MARAKVYERSRGRLVLTQGRTLELLDLRGKGYEQVKAMHNRMVYLLEVAREAFYIQSGQRVELDPTVDGWKFMVEDTPVNQRNFQYLRRKAEHTEALVARRVNEEHGHGDRYKAPTKAGRPRGHTARRPKGEGKVPGGVRLERQPELQPEARGGDEGKGGVQGEQPDDGGAT